MQTKNNIMQIITSNVSGEIRVVVKGEGWITIEKVKPTKQVKTKTGWLLMK